MSPLALALLLAGTAEAAPVAAPYLSNAAVRGQTVTLSVSSLTPGATVRLYADTDPTGARFCPALTAPRCTHLYGTVSNIAIGTLDANGAAIFSLTLPAAARVVTLQAIDSSGLMTRAQPIIVIEPNDDEDGDGLTNASELAEGTLVFESDTDGDTHEDGEEVGNGTSPFDPNDPPPPPPACMDWGPNVSACRSDYNSGVCVGSPNFMGCTSIPSACSHSGMEAAQFFGVWAGTSIVFTNPVRGVSFVGAGQGGAACDFAVRDVAGTELYNAGGSRCEGGLDSKDFMHDAGANVIKSIMLRHVSGASCFISDLVTW